MILKIKKFGHIKALILLQNWPTGQNLESSSTKFSGKCWTCGEEGHPFFKCTKEISKSNPNDYTSRVVREISLRDESDNQENI